MSIACWNYFWSVSNLCEDEKVSCYKILKIFKSEIQPTILPKIHKKIFVLMIRPISLYKYLHNSTL